MVKINTIIRLDKSHKVVSSANWSVMTISDVYFYKICHFPSPPAKIVYTGKRPSPTLLQKNHDIYLNQIMKSAKCFELSEHLSGTTFVDSWPEELQYIPHRVDSDGFRHDPESISRSLRKFYPDDSTLMQFADFLDQGIRQNNLFNNLAR